MSHSMQLATQLRNFSLVLKPDNRPCFCHHASFVSVPCTLAICIHQHKQSCRCSCMHRLCTGQVAMCVHSSLQKRVLLQMKAASKHISHVIEI